jgi:hypothetical protein
METITDVLEILSAIVQVTHAIVDIASKAP